MRQSYEAFAVEEEPAPKAAFHPKLTGYVFLTCVVAASGGMLFGKNAAALGGWMEVLGSKQDLAHGCGWVHEQQMRTDHCLLPTQAMTEESQVASLSWSHLPESSFPTQWASQTPTSTASMMTSYCKHLHQSCTSLELWQLFLLVTSQPSTGGPGQVPCSSTELGSACTKCWKLSLPSMHRAVTHASQGNLCPGQSDDHPNSPDLASD